MPVVTTTRSETKTVVQKVNNDIDILFMVDDSSSMTSMQQKLVTQLPTFMQVLQALPMGLPSVHVAVVSSDMGATSDQGATGIGCSTVGDDGNFFFAPEGTCTATTLSMGATFISDDGEGLMTKNFTAADPGGLASTFGCIALLGQGGCGFEHQLASIDRALGADGNGPIPATNANFLRGDAYLGIVMLTNEDDCSAPASGSPLPVYSLNGDNTNDIDTPAFPGGPPDGPIANYRCNGGPLGGHLCQDLNPGSTNTALAQPPLNPPLDATTGTPPTLPLSKCVSNDTSSSALIPVGKFISDIKALKPDPANQILVAAVTGVNGTAPNATPTPYTVEWLPGAGSASNQLWPQVEHVCVSTNGDGSFADPAVRITQFVQAFGAKGVLASICDPSYSSSMTAIAKSIGGLITPTCITGTIQKDPNGNPNCNVTNELTVDSARKQVFVPACVDDPTAAPCWSFLAANDPMNKCGTAGQALSVTTDPNNPNPDSLDSLIQCETCIAGVSTAGCPCLNNGMDVAGCL